MTDCVFVESAWDFQVKDSHSVKLKSYKPKRRKSMLDMLSLVFGHTPYQAERTLDSVPVAVKKDVYYNEAVRIQKKLQSAGGDAVVE